MDDFEILSCHSKWAGQYRLHRSQVSRWLNSNAGVMFILRNYENIVNDFLCKHISNIWCKNNNHDTLRDHVQSSGSKKAPPTQGTGETTTTKTWCLIASFIAKIFLQSSILQVPDQPGSGEENGVRDAR